MAIVTGEDLPQDNQFHWGWGSGDWTRWLWHEWEDKRVEAAHLRIFSGTLDIQESWESRLQDNMKHQCSSFAQYGKCLTVANYDTEEHSKWAGEEERWKRGKLMEQVAAVSIRWLLQLWTRGFSLPAESEIRLLGQRTEKRGVGLKHLRKIREGKYRNTGFLSRMQDQLRWEILGLWNMRVDKV